MIALVAVLIPSCMEAQQLIVFTNIPDRAPSDQYTCRVRQAVTGTWTNAFVLQTKSRPWNNYSGFNYSNGTTPVDSGPTSVFTANNGDTGYFDRMRLWSASLVAFEFTNMTVEVEISKIAGTITTAVVRPAGAATVVVAGGKATVTMNGYVNLNVDINGQMEGQYTGDNFNNSRTERIHTICIFANPIYPSPTGATCNAALLLHGYAGSQSSRGYDILTISISSNRSPTQFLGAGVLCDSKCSVSILS